VLTLLAFPLLQNFRILVYLHRQQDDGNTKDLRHHLGLRTHNDEVGNEVVDHQCGKDDIPTNIYTVCNGLSNQLAGHAGYIANLIKSGRKVAIPDAFIFNGVQNEKNKDGQTLKNVVASKENSIPLTSIIDAETLLKMIRHHGVDACFIPHDVVILNEQKRMATTCSWLDQLRRSDDEIELHLLSAMKPSISLSGIVELVISNIQDKSSDFSLSEGVCLHHRDGPDWHKHCTLWNGNNCMNAENIAVEDLVKYRMPALYPKKWMYYVGDAIPSTMLVEAMKKQANLELLHRDKDGLASNDQISKIVGNVSDNDKMSVEKYRDIFAAVDFFVCNRVTSFIGNSVSTFSALQTALRRGRNSSWYNSKSIPLLSDFLHVSVIPIVYTYTEESQAMGKVLLKASIISVRQTFGIDIDINVIYYGKEDSIFLNWLDERNVIIHKHEPQWLWMMEEMVSYANKNKSHLYSNLGNYIGTWQRIDIPLFINAEYVLFLDSDTIVRNKFDLSTFGNDITPGIALSKEGQEDMEVPVNAGVALLNVPKLRETYSDFLEFIQDHVENKRDFVLGPSDQGAYLDFYHGYKNPGVRLGYAASTYVRYLDASFNVKPYYKNEETFTKRKIVHFHGLKPHDILKGFMGYKRDEFAIALHPLLSSIFGGNDHHSLCLTLNDFSVSVVEDEDNLDQFCNIGFPSVKKEEMACKSFLQHLSKKEFLYDCEDMMINFGYSIDSSLIRDVTECEKVYLKLHPDVGTAVKDGRIQSDFQHWMDHSKKEGMTPDCCEKGYLKLNPDVRKAVRMGKIQSGFRHWKKKGKKEGRMPGCKEWYTTDDSGIDTSETLKLEKLWMLARGGPMMNGLAN